MKPLSLYLHIPFCKSRCSYCDFYTLANRTLIEHYQEALAHEIIKWGQELASNYEIVTIYFGGGTPSILGEGLGVLLEQVFKTFSVSPAAEISFEANPGTVTPDMLHTLKHAGFNRISLGMQSANETELSILGRTHTLLDVQNAVQMAKSAQFQNISLDLMLGLPSQSIDSLNKTLSSLLALDVQHVSAYLLKLEDGTPLAEHRNRYIFPDEEAECDFYLHTTEVLESHGFLQYEISNFAKKGLASRHNLAYWNGDEYLGIGPSAHSFLDGARFFYEENIQAFLENTKSTTFSTTFVETGGSLSEYLLFRLRLTDGISLPLLTEKYPQFSTIFDQVVENAAPFIQKELVTVTDKKIALTREGFLLSNTLTLKLLDGIL